MKSSILLFIIDILYGSFNAHLKAMHLILGTLEKFRRGYLLVGRLNFRRVGNFNSSQNVIGL